MDLILPKRNYAEKKASQQKYLDDLKSLCDAYGKEIANPKTYIVKKQEYKVKMYELVNQILIIEKTIADTEKHYNNVFLPNYEKELEEVQQNWDIFFKQALTAQNQDIKNVLETYKDELNDVEVKLIVYNKVKSINGFTATQPTPSN